MVERCAVAAMAGDRYPVGSPFLKFIGVQHENSPSGVAPCVCRSSNNGRVLAVPVEDVGSIPDTS